MLPHPRQPMPAEPEAAGRSVERRWIAAGGAPPGGGEFEVLALGVGREDGSGEAGIRRGALGSHRARRRKRELELARRALHGGAGKDGSGSRTRDEVPLGPEIGRHVVMPFEVILGNVGPQGGVGLQMPQRLGLERADLAHRRQIGAAVGCQRHPGERPADVAGHHRGFADGGQRMDEELGQRRLAIGAGDRDQAARPEAAREIQFAHPGDPGRLRRRDPRVVGGKTRRDHREGVPGGIFRSELTAALVVDDSRHAELPEQRQHALATHPTAEDGDGLAEAHLEELGDGERHRQRILSVARPASAKPSDRTQKRSTTLVSGQPSFWKWWWIGAMRKKRRPTP